MTKRIRNRSATTLIAPCFAILALHCAADDEPDVDLGRGGAQSQGGAVSAQGGAFLGGGAGSSNAGEAGIGGEGASTASVAGAGGARVAGGGASSSGAGGIAEAGSAGGSAASRCASKVTVECSLRHIYGGEPQDWSPQAPPWVAAFREVVDVYAINNHQQVVGRRACGLRQHATLIQLNASRDILERLNDFWSEATDINDNGVVIGSVQLAENARALPFIWRDGQTTLLEDPRLLAPIALNNLDQVLLRGTAEAASDFLWTDGSLTAIGSGLSARGLDDVGRVVGETVADVASASKGFVWENGLVTEHPEFASIHRSNSDGQLAGIAPNGRTALWDGETFKVLRADFGLPIGLNDQGIVLGQDRISDSGLAALLSRDFDSVSAQDISQNGNIVARTEATIDNGSRPCVQESCETMAEYAAVWSHECYGSCCGKELAGGASGTDLPPSAGAGGTSN